MDGWATLRRPPSRRKSNDAGSAVDRPRNRRHRVEPGAAPGAGGMTESEHARLAARLVPRRLAQLRLEVLDRLLGDLTHMRLEGFRTLPPVIGGVIADRARAVAPAWPVALRAPSPVRRIAERGL